MIIILNKYYFYDNVFNYSHYKKNKTKLKTIVHGFYYCEYRGQCTFDYNSTTIFFFPFLCLKNYALMVTKTFFLFNSSLYIII
jgi:hypothetical protein